MPLHHDYTFVMQVKIEPSWQKLLTQEFEQPYFKSLIDFVKTEYAQQRICPAGSRIFAAFDACPADKVRVVILGQDPYHGPGQSNGLSFSVSDGIATPPSLRNIYKELLADLGIPICKSGNLERWANQGVFLLNTVLTVREGQAGSHQKKGWEKFTDAVIEQINAHSDHVVFVLWGAPAQKKSVLIDTSKHLILKSVHPSPLSAERGFFGNHHFSQTNAFLESKGLKAIDW